VETMNVAMQAKNLHATVKVFSIWIYDFLKKLLHPNDFNGDNWTNSNRRFAGFAPRNEAPADFYYHDTDNRLSRFLELPDTSSSRKILIEVKSTPKADDGQGFFHSAAQFSLVRLIC
jgi:hypothetical protein